MSLVYFDSDPWLVEYDSCEKLYRDIVEQLNARAAEHWTSDNYAKISASVRMHMKQYATEVQQLKNKLELSHSLTQEETERRSRLVELLQSRNIQLLQRFNDRTGMREQREKLFGGNSETRGVGSNNVFADLGTTSWAGDDDDDEPLPSQPLLDTEVSVNNLRLHQSKMVEEQDKGLEALSKVISRQKEIAVTIGNEVDLQNEIVDDISVRMDRANTSIQRETAHVRVVSKKDNTCGYWMVIIILFIAIIIVAAP
ncbi:syntaxin 8 [Lycorma delicatula]|uniref:syntaxin 8 n=1 Tax=Lycorma delicatula TaxID=130591 RepID=UPI003F513546